MDHLHHTLLVGGMLWKIVIALLSLSLIACATDPAFLLVQKTASIAKVKSSERIAVSIKLFNVGSSAAYDVSLNDDVWPSTKFNIVDGMVTSSWDKLEAGKSLVHTFVLEPKEKGLFHGAPATVRYRVASKSTLQEAYSTPIQELDILSETSPEKRYQWLKNLAMKYGPLTSVVSVMGLIIYILVTPSKSKYSKSKKRR